MVGLPVRPCLAVAPEGLEEGTVNIVIRRGYSAYGGLKWKRKTREREYVTRLCRMMIDHGVPAHHLEDILVRAASRLAVDLAVSLTAENVLLSFSDDLAPTLPLISGDWETVQLACLYDIYRVYEAVASYQMTIFEAIQNLDDISSRKPRYGSAFTLFVYGIACSCIGPLMFNARLLDMPAMFCLGFGLGLLRVFATPQSKFRDVLDMLMVAVTSCLARWLGTISGGQFCFSALTQSIIAILLPGYTVACGCLQLFSSNKGAGSSRIVFAIIQCVVLGFSVTFGTSVYGAINPKATTEQFCTHASAWYYPYLFLVPLVACISILSQANWHQIPVICIVSTVGWLTTNLLKRVLVTEIATLCGAFVLGCMVNAYSALARRSAADVLIAGIFLQLPAGIAAHGSLIGSLSQANVWTQTTSNSTIQAYTSAMATDSIIDLRVPCSVARVAIMMAVGLRMSSWVAFLLGQKQLNC